MPVEGVRPPAACRMCGDFRCQRRQPCAPVKNGSHGPFDAVNPGIERAHSDNGAREGLQRRDGLRDGNLVSNDRQQKGASYRAAQQPGGQIIGMRFHGLSFFRLGSPLLPGLTAERKPPRDA